MPRRSFVALGFFFSLHACGVFIDATCEACQGDPGRTPGTSQVKLALGPPVTVALMQERRPFILDQRGVISTCLANVIQPSNPPQGASRVGTLRASSPLC